MPNELLAQVEAWKIANDIGRSEAIRRLVEMGLSQAKEPGPRVLSTSKEAAVRANEISKKAGTRKDGAE